MLGGLLQFPQQLGEELGPPANYFLQIGRHLARHRKKDIRIFVQFRRKPDNRRLRGWRHIASLDLAQVAWFHLNTLRDLTKAKSGLSLLQAFADGPQIFAETRHVFYVVLSTRTVKSP